MHKILRPTAIKYQDSLNIRKLNNETYHIHRLRSVELKTGKFYLEELRGAIKKVLGLT